MTRKILAGIILTLSSIFLIASLVGVVLSWVYNEPLTKTALARLQGLETELTQAQTALREAKTELERTLRLVEAAEKTFSGLKDNLAQARLLFGEVDATLEKQLVPVLEHSHEQINQAVNSLKETRATLQQINTLPFVNLNIPGEDLLTNLISSGTALDQQIAGTEALVQRTATFMNDTSYLMGGNLTETKQNLQNFLIIINEYDGKLSTWRTQIAGLITSLPGWLDSASVILTIFLLWFGFSQFSLFLHGLQLWRGENPLEVSKIFPNTKR